MRVFFFFLVVRCPDEKSWTVLFKIVLRHFALARPLICTVSAGAHGNRRARSSRQTADQSDTATRFHIPQFHLLAIQRVTLWSLSRRSATLSFQSRLTCAHCVTCTSRTGRVRWSLAPKIPVTHSKQLVCAFKEFWLNPDLHAQICAACQWKCSSQASAKHQNAAFSEVNPAVRRLWKKVTKCLIKMLENQIEVWSI